jgi:hypothetical protein
VCWGSLKFEVAWTKENAFKEFYIVILFGNKNRIKKILSTFSFLENTGTNNDSEAVFYFTTLL